MEIYYQLENGQSFHSYSIWREMVCLVTSVLLPKAHNDLFWMVCQTGTEIWKKIVLMNRVFDTNGI